MANYVLNGGKTVDASNDPVGNVDAFVISGARNRATGHAGIDFFTVNGSRNILFGLDGTDSFTVNGDGNRLSGGAGLDFFTVHGLNSAIDGGAGYDVATVDLTFAVAAITADLSTASTAAGVDLNGTHIAAIESLDIALGAGDDVVTTTGGGNRYVYGYLGDDTITGAGIIEGGAGNDTLTGGSGADVIYGFAAADLAMLGPQPSRDDGLSHDTIDGGGGSDTLVGSLGDDHIDGGANTAGDVDTLVYADYVGSNTHLRVDLAVGSTSGFAGHDTILNIDNVLGSGGTDVLRGDGGANLLVGNEGADTLFGGGGADTLVGGFQATDEGVPIHDKGIDTFVYKQVADTLSSAADTIRYFDQGVDRVDLSQIDADGRRQNGGSAFHFVADAFEGHRGEALLTTDALGTHLYLDIDGDKVADATIDFVGGAPVQSDFVL